MVFYRCIHSGFGISPRDAQTSQKNTQTHKKWPEILSEQELAQVRSKAGLVPLSAYLRNLAINGNEADKDSVRLGEDSVPERRASAEGSGVVGASRGGDNGRAKVYGDTYSTSIAESFAIEKAAVLKKQKCPHGTKKGWRCTLCGGVS